MPRKTKLELIKKLFRGTPLQPVPEQEMHQATYKAFKDAGWESPEECLAAYNNLMKLLGQDYSKLPLRIKRLVGNHELDEIARYTSSIGMDEEYL